MIQETLQCLENLRAAEKKVVDVETLLNSIPEESSIQDLLEELTGASRAHAEAEAQVTARAVELSDHETKVERAQREFEKLATQVLESESATREQIRIGREIRKARDVLDRFKLKITTDNLERIRTNIRESLQALYRKEQLVQDVDIDPESYEVTLRDAHGNHVSQDRLSAGERQLLATGQLWGLSKSTTRQLPAVIDTPVGRLDSSHRSHLVDRYFPNAGRQVVLLSTDEEIVGEYQRKLDPSVGKTYLLEYRPETNSSEITEGYFS